MSISGFNIIINVARESEAGEDAVACKANDNMCMLAVADGCGGAGARRYSRAGGKTGAEIGSALLASSCGKFFGQCAHNGRYDNTVGKIKEKLESCISDSFSEANESIATGTTAFSRLSKTFPTTLAMLMCEIEDVNTYRIISAWAGDSRCLLLTADGLKQLSDDDVVGGKDPYSCAQNDDILSNVICADTRPNIHVTERAVKEPCLALCITDGCYSWLKSPMLFEGLLYDTLNKAKSLYEWESLLEEYIGETASDDYSIVMTVLGFSNFGAIKTALLENCETYNSTYRFPVLKALEEKREDTHRALWEKYKKYYLCR